MCWGKNYIHGESAYSNSRKSPYSVFGQNLSIIEMGIRSFLLAKKPTKIEVPRHTAVKKHQFFRWRICVFGDRPNFDSAEFGLLKIRLQIFVRARAFFKNDKNISFFCQKNFEHFE